MKLDQLEEVQVRQDCCMVVDEGCCREYGEMEMRRLCLLDYFRPSSRLQGSCGGVQWPGECFGVV